MGYGSQLIGLSDQSRQRGFAGLESGLSRLMAASQQASQQAFAAREARRQREFQEEQRKKQESAQKKAMWTSLGINAGAGAAGGAVTGALAASQPAIGAATATPQGINPAAQAGLDASFAAAAPTYTPFAGGSVGGGALAGGAMGALGGLSGQNYLGSALAMPGQNYALASNAFNDANNTALQWAKYAQSDRQNEADNAAAMERAKLGAETRQNVAVLPWQMGVRPDTQARVEASTANNAATNQTRMDINESRLPFLQGTLDERRRSNDIRENIGGRGMDLRERGLNIQQQRANTYEKGYGSGDGRGMTPTISMSSNGVSVSGKDPNRVRETYNSATGTIPDGFEGAKIRVANHLNEGTDPEPTIAFMVKQGTITPQQADEIRRRLQGR